MGRHRVSFSPQLGCLPGRMGLWGHRKEAKGRIEDAGGRGPLGGAGEEQRVIAPPTWEWEPAGLSGEVPCPLRPGVGGHAWALSVA